MAGRQQHLLSQTACKQFLKYKDTGNGSALLELNRHASFQPHALHS